MAQGALQRLAGGCLSGRLAGLLKEQQQQQQAWRLLGSGMCGGTGSTCVGGGLAGLLRGGAAAAPAGASAAWAYGSGVRHMGTGVEGMADKTLAKARKLAVAVGALAGVFGSLVGVGGGVLISPIIANACKSIPQRVISGTSLAAVVATGSSAGYVYWSSGAVDPTSAAVVAASAVALTPLGARATHLVDCATLRRLMAYWLFLVAPLVPLKPLLMKHYAGTATAAAAADDDGNGNGSAAAAGGEVAVAQQQGGASTSSSSSTSGSGTVWRPLRSSDGVLAATGMLAGFASGLLGIGGGTVVTPLLTVATGLPQLNVLGTSLTAMVVPSLVGLAQHARLGNVDWIMAAGLAAGTLVGGGVGGKLAVNMPEGVLEWVFCLGMLYLGRKTLASVGGKAAGKGAAGKGTPGVLGAGAGTAGSGQK